MIDERQQNIENPVQDPAQAVGGKSDEPRPTDSPLLHKGQGVLRHRSGLLLWIHRATVVLSALVSLEVLRALVGLAITIMELHIHSEIRSNNQHTRTSGAEPVPADFGWSEEAVANESKDSAALKQSEGGTVSNDTAQFATAATPQLAEQPKARRSAPRSRNGSFRNNVTTEVPEIDFSDETASSCLDKACAAAQEKWYSEARTWLYGAFQCTGTDEAKEKLRRRALLRPELKALYQEIEDGAFDTIPAKQSPKRHDALGR